LPDSLLHERRQRARAVLSQFSIISEGTAMGWDSEGSVQPGSRGPVSEDAIDREAERNPGDCPPESKSLYDHWRCKFARAWNDEERLLYQVLLAEERLGRIRRSPPIAQELPTGERLTDAIATSRGAPADIAARYARHQVTMSHVRTVRLRQRRDPETGDPWLWPHESMNGMMSSEAKERAKEYAREVAIEMAAAGESQRRISEAIGIPRATLQRMLGAPGPEGTL
jgi:hypothetical protein